MYEQGKYELYQNVWHLFNNDNCIPLTVKGELYEFCSSCLNCVKALA
jgi:hypothetical protein